MKLPRPVILLLPLAAVLVLVWLWLGQQEGPARELAGNDGADQVMAPQFKAYDPGSAVTGPESLEVPLPSPDKNAIPGEFTLIFKDAESMEAFLESAEAAGIKILGTL